MVVVCELGVSCVSHFSRCCGRFIVRQLWLVLLCLVVAMAMATGDGILWPGVGFVRFL